MSQTLNRRDMLKSLPGAIALCVLAPTKAICSPKAEKAFVMFCTLVQKQHCEFHGSHSYKADTLFMFLSNGAEMEVWIDDKDTMNASESRCSRAFRDEEATKWPKDQVPGFSDAYMKQMELNFMVGEIYAGKYFRHHNPELKFENCWEDMPEYQEI